jgi:cyclohexanecarboxylate-CoA ligase
VLTPTRPHAFDYDLPGLTFVDCLRRAVAEHGDVTAVVEGDFSATFAELAAAAERVATGLRERGVRPGDRVVTQLPNWWESVVVSWGTFLAGAVLVPVVPIYRTHEMRFIISQVQPRAVIAPAWFRSYPHAAELRTVIDELGVGAAVLSVRGETPGAEALDALLDQTTEPSEAASRPDDIAVILYTSGTTSQPKGVLHSHQTLLAEARDVAAGCRLDGADRVFMASPLSHITGLSYGIVLPVDLGCAVVLQDRWDPQAAVRLIEESGCTFTVSATPFLRGLADAYDGRGPSRLRVFVCGGADIPAELVRRASRIMGTRVVRTYGSTELPTSSMADPFGDLDAAATGEGKPMGRNEMVVRDEGDGPELLVRGPELFLGYLDAELNQGAFTDDGYFRTGDQARVEIDSTVRITGRIKDIINRGGEKFSVAEVEALLLDCPSVRDVAVVSFPDPVLVERACAYVVPAPGCAPTLEELREHLLAAGLAVQKAPERLVIVADLPRTASGKVQRFVLREELRHELCDEPRQPDTDADVASPGPARG